MTTIQALSATAHGVDARLVVIEAVSCSGSAGVTIVGLSENHARESRVRLRAAFANHEILAPRRPTTLYLRSDGRPSGCHLDLALAVAAYAVDQADLRRLGDTLLLGELSLGGDLRASRGLLPQLRAAREFGIRRALVPQVQLDEARLVDGIKAVGVRDLPEALSALFGEVSALDAEPSAPTPHQHLPQAAACMSEVRGQYAAKRALEVAAAGRHPILLVGAPGTGKTMLARRLPGIMPEPSATEAEEIACIASAAGLSIVQRPRRPLRAPHHTASMAALMGGGSPTRPGEATLAHHGVLFLDELPEFGRDTAHQLLRTATTTGEVIHHRESQGRIVMPAAPLLMAAMMPCPCGWLGDTARACSCPDARLAAYQDRVAPLVGRFHMHLPIQHQRDSAPRGDTSESIQRRVTAAAERLAKLPPVDPSDLSPDCHRLLGQARESGLREGDLPTVLSVARTIAALAARDTVSVAYLAEALTYRPA